MERSKEEVRLVQRLLSCGLSFRVDSDRLLVSPPEKISDEARAAIVENKPLLVSVFSGCRECKKALISYDDRCFKCMWRRCDGCGGPTGSAFISNCLRCQAEGRC